MNHEIIEMIKYKGGTVMLDRLPFDLYQLNLFTIILRVGLAILVGGIIGTERDIKNRAAGIRTHMLVCVGAAVVMMTNQYVVEAFPDIDVDVTRMGAQVVSGIGFLGAGTILVTRHNQIRGLTTAAGLWAAATLGLAIGIGFYEMALVGIIAVLFIVIFLQPFKQLIHHHADASYFSLILYLNQNLDEFLAFTSDSGIKIVNMNIDRNETTDKSYTTIVKVTVDLDQNLDKEDFIHQLKELDSVDHVLEVEGSQE